MSMKKLSEMTSRELGRLGGKARAARRTPEELSAYGRLGRQALEAKYSYEERRQFLLKGGRPRPKLTDKKFARLKRLLKSGRRQAQIAKALGVSTWTVARYIRRLQEARMVE
jgi:hypothetical protein